MVETHGCTHACMVTAHGFAHVCTVEGTWMYSELLLLTKLLSYFVCIGINCGCLLT